LRAKSNSEAQLGQFKGSGDENANQSLYVADYKYWGIFSNIMILFSLSFVIKFLNSNIYFFM